MKRIEPSAQARTSRTAPCHVELSVDIRWSGPPISYDLSDRSDQARVYEQVLREGTEDNVRFYVDPEQLRELFDDLVLPPVVRRRRAEWLRRHPGGE